MKLACVVKKIIIGIGCSTIIGIGCSIIAIINLGALSILALCFGLLVIGHDSDNIFKPLIIGWAINIIILVIIIGFIYLWKWADRNC